MKKKVKILRPEEIDVDKLSPEAKRVWGSFLRYAPDMLKEIEKLAKEERWDDESD
ncbi:MAG: hypothetical protein ACE5KT_09490 [Methanosarcinales archaeon]